METLDRVPEYEREYFAQCVLCKDFFDCRDLSQVVEHMHDNMPVDATSGISRRVSEPVEYLRGKIRIDAN